VLNDDVGTARETAVQEREGVLRQFTEPWSGGMPGTRLVWADSDERRLADAPSLDVLVVDYGALHGGYGREAARAHSYTAAVRRYTDIHPGTLVILWTGHTEEIFAGELDDELVAGAGQDNGNIMFRYARSPYGGFAHGREAAGFWRRVRTWLGAPDPEPDAEVSALTAPGRPRPGLVRPGETPEEPS
jgi:hypothetical protein